MMLENNIKKHRCSIRLKDYDYSQAGMYFITICVKDRKCLFGEIKDEEIVLNELGKFINDFWYKIIKHFYNVDLDEFIVMPNHLHGVIIINDRRGGVSPPCTPVENQGGETPPLQPITSNQGGETPPLQPITSNQGGETPPLQPTLGQIIGYYKYQTTKQINKIYNCAGKQFWQRNYYDHIIRNEKSLDKIRQYIYNNAGNWQSDIENLDNNKIITEQQRENYYKNIF